MDLLAVERELEEGAGGPTAPSPSVSPQKLPIVGADGEVLMSPADPDPEPEEGELHPPAAPEPGAAGVGAPFHGDSSKSNTLKKYYKKLFKSKKDKAKASSAGSEGPSGEGLGAGGGAGGGGGMSAAGSRRVTAEPLRPQPSAAQRSDSSRSARGDGEEAGSAATAAASAPPHYHAAPSTSGAEVGTPAPGGGRLLPSRFEMLGSGRFDDDGAASTISAYDSRMSTLSSGAGAGAMGGTLKGLLGPRKNKVKKQIEMDALRCAHARPQWGQSTVARNGGLPCAR